MNALARTVPVVFAVAALIAALHVGCIGGSQADASVDAGDGGSPDATAQPTLSIDPEPLISLVVGDNLQYPLHADGGVPPYAWGLRQDAGLDWLHVGASSGYLIGSPDAATGGPTPFTVEVRDDAGNRALRDLQITVSACLDGNTHLCALELPVSACIVGIATCSGGQYGTCDGGPGGGSYSTDFAVCTNCQPCDPVTANQCVGGLCQCGDDAGCNAGQQCCVDQDSSGHVCATLSSDPKHCSSCDTSCPGYSHAPAQCVAGTCSAPCEQGYASCDGGLACDVSILTEVANCGSCGNVCTVPGDAGGTAFCDGGSCGYACDLDVLDCPGRGCTSKLDLDNCGACGVVCRPGAPHVLSGGPTCVSGGCSGTCESGWGNCDGDWSNGCETDVDAGTGAAGNENCGVCGNTCPLGGPYGDYYCSGGRCRMFCTDVFTCTYPAKCTTCPPDGHDCCQ